MFESFTYDYLMQSMLANVPNDLDKREGSVIWDALAPAALELETAYCFLEWVFNQSFADTADRDCLILRAHERGLLPKEATPAVLKGEFAPTSLTIPIGTRFNLGDLNYQVTEAITGEAGSYKLTCETPGIQGHQKLGTLIPIEDFTGLDTLQSANATSVLIPGEDEEDTEVFRNRYLNDFNPIRFGGNISQYIDWVNDINGVGASRVKRRSAGERKVIVTIINSEYSKASSALVSSVQNSLDPNSDGAGDGIAPIGHEVTVEAADNETINIYIEVVFDTGKSYSNMMSAITDIIEAYLLELRQDWGNYSSGTATIVRIAQIETRILALSGVLDIQNTKINGVAANYSCTDNKIPVLGVITHD
jgi:uncharacterized phage protein gp47/JayE